MQAFLTVALIHLLAVASPGPDFAVIVKQSLSQPRRNVLLTALGFALGMLLHTTYCLLGIGLLISRSILLFNTIKWIGAAYLLFIGWKALTSKYHKQESMHVEKKPPMKAVRALRMGFLCNALNPKATLFILAVFTQVINPSTPTAVQLFYGLYMAFATFAWFAMIGSALTTGAVRKRIGVIHLWAEKCMGVVLIALGLKVAFSGRK